MKLVIIHGPPAAGKHTVGAEIARRTGFKLFHNHVTIDCVKSVLEFGGPEFWSLNTLIRVAIIAAAARQNISVIHTFCYEYAADDEQFAELVAAAEDNGGEVHIVLLRCDPDERKRRIGNESRVRIGKLTDPDSVDRPGKIIELSKPFPGRETLIIDTTRTSPDATASQIIETFGLQEQ